MNKFETEKLREALLDLERSRQKEEFERKIAECLVSGLRIISSTSDREELFARIVKHINTMIPFTYGFLMRENNGAHTEECELQPVYPLKMNNIKLDKRLSNFNLTPFCIFDVTGWQSCLFQDITKDECINGSLLILPLATEEGKYWLFMLSPIKNSLGRQHIAIASRLSELLKQAISKDEYIVKLMQSNKMRALGEMAGGIAHEINNPLAIIQGSLEILNRLLEPEELSRTEHIIKTIEKTVDRVSKIIHGLRVLSHGEISVNYRSNVSLDEILIDTLSCCQEKFRSSGVKLAVDIDASIKNDKFHLNRTLLSQVFLNILNNAYDAIKNNDDKWIKIQVSKSSNELDFFFIDSGLGIPKELQSKIFQPFFTTKGVGEGTGIGLRVCKSIIEDLNGSIYVDENFKNTCFHVVIPINP